MIIDQGDLDDQFDQVYQGGWVDEDDKQILYFGGIFVIFG